jgi:hypothetical protein
MTCLNNRYVIISFNKLSGKINLFSSFYLLNKGINFFAQYTDDTTAMLPPT